MHAKGYIVDRYLETIYILYYIVYIYVCVCLTYMRYTRIDANIVLLRMAWLLVPGVSSVTNYRKKPENPRSQTIVCTSSTMVGVNGVNFCRVLKIDAWLRHVGTMLFTRF